MRLLGRPPSQARGMKSLPRNSLSIGMIIFVSVIGVMMLAHLASLIAVSSGRDCNNLLFHIRGNESSLGPMQVVFLCCVAGLGVVAAHAFSGVWLRTWDLQSALMGTLTLILLVLSMAYCAVYLAFAFPTHPVSKWVNSWAQIFQMESVAFEPFEWTHPIANHPDWRRMQTGSRRNDTLGLIERYEVGRVCFSEPFIEANYRARFPHSDYSGAPVNAVEMAYVYYDLEGRFIDAPSVMWYEPRFETRRAEAYADTGRMSAFDLDRLAYGYMSPPPSPYEWQVPPLPDRAEILAIVEEQWRQFEASEAATEGHSD